MGLLEVPSQRPVGKEHLKQCTQTITTNNWTIIKPRSRPADMSAQRFFEVRYSAIYICITAEMLSDETSSWSRCLLIVSKDARNTKPKFGPWLTSDSQEQPEHRRETLKLSTRKWPLTLWVHLMHTDVRILMSKQDTNYTRNHSLLVS